jgi:integrase
MDRFPDWTPEADPKVARGGVSLRSLFDRWKAEADPAASKVAEWQRSIDGFIAYIRHDDATRITKAEVAGWEAELLSKGLSANTINDTKLAALRRVLAWGVDNGPLSDNPAQGVTIRRKPKPGEDMDGFSDAQAAAILIAAAASQRAPIHWMPLLGAGTGARVGEMCQFRGEDVEEVDGIAVLRITAEAGSVKNAPSERTIPLPPSAIETGFLDFAQGRKGPLFYDPNRRNPEAKRPPHKIVANRIADWIRSSNIKGVGREARVAPNHGWRHRFHTKARAAEVSDQVADRITGLGAAKRSGAKYGRAELEAMLRAIERGSSQKGLDWYRDASRREGRP